MAGPKTVNTAFIDSYGPWALVTGASEGIGEAMARDIAGRGVNVALVARRRERLATVAAGIAATHKVSTRVVAIDLAEPGAASAVMADLADLDLGLLAACAGFGTAGRARRPAG